MVKHIVLDRDKPLVSIVVPMFNAQQFVGTTLNCLVGQTFKDIEIIVVNDGSTDRSKDVVEKFLFDRRLRYFEKENGGTGSALNFGHRLARGKYITWCSSDNVYYPQFVETFVKAFKQIELQNFDAEFLYSDFSFIDARGRKLRDVVHKPIPKTDLVNGYDFGISFMYTKALWEKTGEYWNRICEDYNWCVRAMQHTQPALISGLLAAFRVHGGQITGSRKEEEAAAAAECRELAKNLLLKDEQSAVESV